jgi:hypothetical protein
MEQRDRLGLGCGLSPTKWFSKTYGAGDTTQGFRYIRCDWRLMIRRETLPLVILNSLISVISDSGIRAMSAPFHLELIRKLWLWFLVVFIWFVVSILWFILENSWKLCSVFKTDRFLDCMMLWLDFDIFMLSK